MTVERILLIGGTGRLGSVLLKRLQEDGYEVWAPTRKELNMEWDQNSLSAQLENYDPGIIINCSAMNGPERCAENHDRAYVINSLAPKSLASYCAKKDSLFIHFSTDYTIAGDGAPTTDANNLDERSPYYRFGSWYAESKALGEIAIRETGTDYMILRVASLYGSSDLSGPLDVVKQAQNGRGSKGDPIRVLHQRCSPISVRLAAALTARLLRMCPRDEWPQRTGIWHLVASSSCWKADLAAFTLGLLYPGREWAIREGSLAIPRPEHCGLSNAKLTALLGPIPSVREDMAETLKWMGLMK